ncbi:hypothetical protein Zm00014a_010941 [Zea mays]|uniref:Uncharacterized protein n=1 Tax=Zea mays TaxID=4577 RepID=A0A3L6FUF7_MAIZE|nr:hypothetical protein Zm00014a_010941 [Zea mays]
MVSSNIIYIYPLYLLSSISIFYSLL